MELCMREKAVFFLPVNILTVWSPAFLAARHTTMCLDIYIYKTHSLNCHVTLSHRPQIKGTARATSFVCSPASRATYEQGRLEKLRGPGQRVTVGPFTQVVR